MRMLVSVFALVFAAAAQAAQPVPVTIGEVSELDACTGLAVVASGSQVVLRSGPGDNFSRLTTLKPGEYVHLCNASADGMWSGVVLAQDGIIDCGVTSPVPAPRPYYGLCTSGWLPTKRLEPVAG